MLVGDLKAKLAKAEDGDEVVVEVVCAKDADDSLEIEEVTRTVFERPANSDGHQYVTIYVRGEDASRSFEILASEVRL